MKPLVKIKSVALTRFNNSEYVNFMTRFLALVDSAGMMAEDESTSVLGFSVVDTTDLKQDLRLMNDIVAQSRISDHTAVLLVIDKKRSEVVVYLFSLLRAEQSSPIETKKKNATSLYNQVKPYVGCHRLPNQQKTVQIAGLLTDLKKESNRSLVTSLGLDEVIVDLEETNGSYASLTAQRTDEMAAAKLDESKVVRQRMNELYDFMVTTAFAHSVVNPTEETASFVTSLNALIDEVTSLYNQRIAQMKREKKEQKEE